MAANTEHAASTATNLNNPFLNPDEKVVLVAEVPVVPAGAGAGGLADPLRVDSTRIAGTGNDQAISSAGLGGAGSSSSATSGLSNPLENTHRVTGEHAQHAGALAPSESTVAPAQVPEGTGHVTNILTGIAGAVLSAPAAALEAISPKAAGKTSDGVALISSKMPAVSLEDAANTARGAAASAYNAVPEGTAATLQSYTGAAVAKAQEVLPPALGGSAAKGNTGEGDLAKSPTQLASEYGNAASASISNAAASASAYIQQTLGLAQQKASDAATVASQKASEAANITSQKASEATTAASQTASDLSNTASATASQAAESTRQTANQAAEATRQTANQAAESTRQTAESTRQAAADYTEAAKQSANQAAESTRQTAADYSASAQQTANQAADSARRSTTSSSTSGSTDPYLYGAMPSGTSGTHVSNVRSEPAFSTTSSSQPATLHSANPVTTATQTHTGQPGTYEYTEDQLKNSRTAL